MILSLIHISLSIIYISIVLIHIYNIFPCTVKKPIMLLLGMSCTLGYLMINVLYHIPYVIASVTVPIVLIVIVYGFFKTSLLNIVYLVCMNMFPLFVINLIVYCTYAMLQSVSFQAIVNAHVDDAMISVITLSIALVFLIIKRLVFPPAKIQRIAGYPGYVKALIGLLVGMGIVLIIITRLTIRDSDIIWMNVLQALVAYVMLFGFYGILQYISTLCELDEIKENKNYLQQQLYNQLQQYERQSAYIKSFRKIKHDITNQLKGLTYLLADKEFDKALAYISEFDYQLQETGKLYQQFSNHALIDAILQDAFNRCQKANVQFKAIVNIKDSELTDLQLCTLFTNLLNNAIEANDNVVDEKARYINIQSNVVDGWFILHIENRYSGILISDGKHFLTTKKDKDHHGIGLLSVREITESVGGILSQETDDKHHVFHTNLVIPVKESNE